MAVFSGKLYRYFLPTATVFCWLPAMVTGAQPPAQSGLRGRFLTDSIEIGRPFRYALTYDHAPTADVLFPDTARHFAPFRVQNITVFPTETSGTGPQAVSRDSAVYTLVSFAVDSAQTLRVPVRLINPTDCTSLLTQPDTVFLRSKLTRPVALTLAGATELAPLRQEFNYPLLGLAVLLLSLAGFLFYGLFRRPIQRLYGLYRLNRQHRRFLREYNRLSQGLNSTTAPESANQAVILWKTYLEQLERRPYASLTTSEIAERLADGRVADALREADRMIYGGGYSAQSQPALRLLSDVATQTYHRYRLALQNGGLTIETKT